MEEFKRIPFSPPPPTQARSSATFRLPPLDGTISLLECYDWHLNNTTQHPFFLYAEDDGTTRTLLWPEVVRAGHRAGRIISSSIPDSSRVKVVAVLAASDMITYFTCNLGIMRAGFVLFPVSPRNSPAAIAHLLSKARVDHLVLGPEKMFTDLSNAALATLPPDYTTPSTSTLPSFKDIYLDSDEFEPLPPLKINMNDPVFLLHSSGSTAFPKVVVWTHLYMIKYPTIPALGEVDFTGLVWACHSVPMFHGLGMTLLMWAPTCGFAISTFPPRSPAILPTPANVIEGAMRTKGNIIFSVPAFIEAWLKHPEYDEYLRGTKGILYGAGPLNKAVGDAFTDKGVSIYTLYGSSETTIINVFLPADKPGKDWQYFHFSKHIKVHLLENGQGQAELVLVSNPLMVPMMTNISIDGVPSYATGDLLEPHPTKPGLWKVYGRTDDQIMHSTGEKTNPGPLEAMMCQDPYVAACVMFGRSQFHAGIVVEPIPQEKFDPRDSVKLAEFRNKIWPTVEKMNEYAPQHSRIFKEMIVVASPEKPFVWTAKMTARRSTILADYEAEIAAAYEAFQESTQLDIAPPPAWTIPTTRRFVRAIVSNTMQRTVSDEDDLFRNGCDSLQATWIRNAVLRALCDTTKRNTRAISSSLLYQNPTINSLSDFAFRFATESLQASVQDLEVESAEMHKMVDAFTKEFPTSVDAAPRAMDTVLLTGSTGGLGIELLNVLLQDDKVERVFALNRPLDGPKSLRERHESVLKERGMDLEILSSPKLRLLGADLTSPDLGLSAEAMSEMRSSVTHIIHNAWSVHFNAPLSSFQDNVRGLRNLVDLALESSARLVFTSSIGVVSGGGLREPVKEAFVDSSPAMANGYTKSKWVGEQVLKIASSSAGLKAVVVRVGQLTGGSNGAWKTSEWLPALVKSSVHLGFVPSIDKHVSWIQIDSAAACISSMRDAEPGVIHLVHPRPVSGLEIFQALAKNLRVPTTTYHQWIELLQACDEVEAAPAVMLLDFFKGVEGHGGLGEEAMGMPSLETSRAMEQCRVLSSNDRIPSLDSSEVEKWVDYWFRVGFL